MAVAYVKYLGDTSNKTAGTTLAQVLQGGGSAAGNLIVASVIYDNAATAGKPRVATISKMAGETANWIFLGAASSTSTSAGAFASGEMWCIQTTVAWTGTITVTLDTSTTQKAVLMQEFSGVQAVVRNTVGTAYSTTTTQASVATTGTTPVIGDLAIGLIFNSNAAAQPSGDNDTLGGSWSAVAGLGSTGGNVATNNFGGAQYKILTAASHQTLNNSAALNAGNGAIVAILQATPTPAIQQAAVQFFADGTETGSVALGSVNANPIVSLDGGDYNLQVRIRLQLTTAVDTTATDDWQLQADKNGAGAWANVGLIDGYSSGPTQLYVDDVGGETTGQSFVGNGRALGRAAFYLDKVGSPTGTHTAVVYAHSGTFGSTGVGTGTPLATSTVVNESSVPTGSNWVNFTFDGTFTPVNGTFYVIALVHSASDASNYLALRGNSAGTHAGNACYRTPAGAWSTLSGDIAFAIYPTTVAPYDSASLTDGAATTNRMGAGTGTFVAGEISEVGLVTDLGWTGNNYTELVYSVRLVAADLLNSDYLRFRVLYNGSTSLMTYTQQPFVGVTKTAVAVTQAAYQFFDDAGTESGAPALAAPNTQVNGNITNGDGYGSLRVLLQSTTVASLPATDDWQLQFQKNAGAWTNVASSGLIDSYLDIPPNQTFSFTTAGETHGQSFKGDGRTLVQAAFYMGWSSGTPPGTITAVLYAHSGTYGTSSVGTGAILATSAPINATDIVALVAGGDAWVYFTFDGTYVLANGQAYVIGIVHSAALSGMIRAGGAGPTHGGNQSYRSAAGAWSSFASVDMLFQILGPTPSVLSYNNPALTDGAATTNRMSGTGTFSAGKVSETGLVSDVGWPGNRYTELLYSLKLLAAQLASGDVLNFRVLRNGVTTLMTYTQTPTVNITTIAKTVEAVAGGAWGSDLGMSVAGAGYASTPDSNALDIMNDYEIVVRLALNDWTNSGTNQGMLHKDDAAGARSYGFMSLSPGTLYLEHFLSTATYYDEYRSSVNLPLVNARVYWIKARLQMNAPTNQTVTFWWADDQPFEPTAAQWNQLGTSFTTSPDTYTGRNTTASVTVGGRGGTDSFATGTFLRALLRGGPSFTLVADFNPTKDNSAGKTTWVSSATGEVWSLNGTSSIIQAANSRGGLVGIAFATKPSLVQATPVVGAWGGMTGAATAARQVEATPVAGAWGGMVGAVTATVSSPVPATISTAFAFTATSTAVPQHAATINTQFGPPSTAPFLSEPFNDFTTNGWVLVSPTRTTIVAGGRTGNGAQVLTSGTNNGLIKYTIASGSRSADLVVGFAWKLDDFANSPKIVEFYGDTDTTVHTSIRVGNTTGALYYLLGGTTFAFTADGVLAPNTWYYIEVALHLADSPNGTYNIRVNGTTVLSGTGDTKNGGTATVYDTIRLGPNTTFGSPTSVYDDLYLDPGSTTFRGDPLSAGPPGVWAATATVQHPATAPGPFTFTATATAVPSHPASISTAFSFTATATAVHMVQATIGAAITTFVPLYVYPSYLGWWNPYYANPPNWGVVNVSGGPGTSANADYTTGITNLRALGSKLIGYVDTNYGAVSIAQVKTDIDNWFTLYNVDGIFFDRVASTTAPGDIAYMLDASNYAKAKSAGWKVAFNHGTYPLVKDYVDQADFSIVFEDVSSTYVSFSIPGYAASYVNNYPKSRWVHLVLSCATETDMITALNKAVGLGVGNFHATTDAYFAEIPPYYPREIAQPQFVFTGTAAATSGPTNVQVEATIATAFSFTTTATATPSHPATIATTFGFTATTTAVPIHPATISTAFTLTATATAVLQHPATISTTFGFTATAAAVLTHPATIATTFAFTATAVAIPVYQANIATTFAFAAVATAVPSRPATIADTYTFTATAVAITTHQATISTAFGFAATADAIPSSPGQATIATTFDFTATATAVRTLPATAVGPYIFTATALATPQHPATISTAFSFTATSTATLTHLATIATVFSFSASTTATPVHLATITTTWTFTATASATSGTAAVTVQATIATRFTFAGTALAKVVSTYTVLNTADSIYVGTQRANAVYVGSTKVWPGL